MSSDRSFVDLDRVLADQAGVVSRRQLLDLGLRDHDLARLVRRRILVRVHPGVYVDHTGSLSWPQTAWAAVLYFSPAALHGPSALVHHGLRPPVVDEPVHILLDHARRPDPLEGVRLHRSRHAARLLHPARRPPVVRLEPAVLHVASTARDEAAAVAVLADACQSRRTTAARLAAALEELGHLPGRAFLTTLLGDVACGAFSALEQRYLTRVERPHRLPPARRQRVTRTGPKVGYRDVEYLSGRVVVELDGRLGHEWAEDRWDDLERDIVGLEGGSVTIRVGRRQVLDPCRLAGAVGRLLVAAGWDGRPARCRPDCVAARS